MATTKATLLQHTRPAQECPVLDGAAIVQYKQATRAANEFSLAVLKFLDGKPVADQVAWLRTSVDSSRAIFQPWNLEILYLLAVLGRARFSQLHALLGLSTRTLSNKLKTLRKDHFIVRDVIDDQPVRIEYHPTKHGLRTAALASPLFAHLNLEALRAAGRL